MLSKLKRLWKEKGMNLEIWVIGKLNQIFSRDKLRLNFEKKVVRDKTPLFVIGPFCTLRSICLNIGF